MTSTASIVRFLILVYRAVRLPRPPACRYVPTCSAYALEAIDRHGATKGTWLAVKRISRCAPWGGWGSDPVPDKVTTSKMQRSH